MPVARLRLRIITTWEREDEDGTRQVSESTRGLDLSLGNFGRALGSRRGGLRLWHKIALLTSPALFTLAKHLIGVAGGLLTMGAVVSAAALPWVGLAVTAARNAERMGPAGERFMRGADGVKKAWMQLARDTAPETLGPVTDVLNGIAAAIPKLEPLVRQIAPDMARMGKDIRNWLSGRGFERFLENIQEYGVPAFRNLVASGKDFLATIGIGFRQFLPLARDISSTLRDGAQDLLRAARSGGVQRWLRDWRNSSDTANRFLREAADTVRIVATLLDDMGPGMLRAIDTGLGALNSVNPYVLMGIVLGLAAGKGIIGLVAALRMLQAIRALRAISFLPTAAHLGSAATALYGAATAISGMAASISRLAAMVARLGLRVRVNTGALDNIKKIWEATPKNAVATASVPSLNLMIVAMMGVSVTWATVQGNLAQAAVFSARAEVGLALGVMTAVLGAWIGVRIIGLSTPVFTAVAIALAVASMNIIVVAWARVRAVAALPALFTAMGSPGNVPSVASTIIAAWARVRAASAVRPRFTATAIGGNVVAGAAMIVAAWMRVARMPKLFRAMGIVRPGNVPGASRAIYSSWRRLYNLARTWSGIATCNFSGGFSGISGPSGPMLPSMGGGTPIQGGYGPLPGPVGNILQKIPGFDNFGSTPDYLGGGDPFFPDDFGGSFGRAYGGPIGSSLNYGRASAVKTGGGERRSSTLHIYDDVWIRSPEDLVNILLNAGR